MGPFPQGGGDPEGWNLASFVQPLQLQKGKAAENNPGKGKENEGRKGESTVPRENGLKTGLLTWKDIGRSWETGKHVGVTELTAGLFSLWPRRISKPHCGPRGP